MIETTESSVTAAPARLGGGQGALVVRPARRADVDGLFRLAEAAGSGMTNLQADRALLRERLTASEAALLSEDYRARGLPIFFVVERVGADGSAAAHPSA